MKKAIIFDIHGTLIENDKPILKMIDLANMYAEDSKYEVILSTAQNIKDEKLKNQLLATLKKYAISFKDLYTNSTAVEDDVEAKKISLKRMLKDGYDIYLAVDNKKEACKMYKNEGIDTLRFKLAK